MRSPEPVRAAALAVFFAFAGAAADAAPIVAVDDAGRTLTLARPAARVVTLAPSLTELVFAAGGGAAVVATDSSSDYPAAVRSLPRVGDAARLDVERIVALQPDLVVVWRHGNTTREVDQLEAIGLHVFRLEPQRLDEVPRAIERLGVVLGHEATGRSAAEALRAALGKLRDRYATAAPVRVFYQVWSSPLMTVNRGQIVNDVIELCGGRNVFASLAPLVPQVSIEAVVAAGPEVIFTADELGAPAFVRRDSDAAAFAVWRSIHAFAAAQHGWLYTLNGDVISRQGPRIADGAAAMCTALDEVRRERRGIAPR